MADNNSDINKTIILKKYKYDIENSTDHSFLQGVQQAVLGWHDTKFVKDNIPQKHLSVLNGKEELLTTIVAQNMAIGQLRNEKISASTKTFLKDSDLETLIEEVIGKRDTLSKEDIESATSKFRESVKSKNEVEELKKKEIQEKSRNKGRKFI